MVREQELGQLSGMRLGAVPYIGKRAHQHRRFTRIASVFACINISIYA